MAYFMEDMTVRDFKQALENVKTVIIPVGCVEQHGYHLPLSVDMINAAEVPRRAGDRLRAVVAPTVFYSFSGGELPGTVNVSPQVFSLYITDICCEFVRMGFKNIVVFLGHSGTENTESIKSCLQTHMRRNPQYSKINFSVLELWKLSPTWVEIFTGGGPEYDYHAGQVETSLMMYWRPELVQPDIVMDTPYLSKMMRTDPDWYAESKKIIDHEYIIPNVRQRGEIEIGVMGFPEKATAGLGKIVSDEMAEGLMAYIDMLENNELNEGEI